ncbi:MAG: hypothetical protein HFF62_00905 [Oscillospiraceae bacterium]|jgi:hypothetical protein|nr:hypothetical protein [uncultured Oscillibacter sp.]MCI9505136.1 hypothetical protein [Oscillospiraceae bacterium]
MQLWQDGLLAMLAAVGLASLLWGLVRAVLCPGTPRQRSLVALIPAQGNGETLEQQVRTLRRIRQEQNVFSLILLVDCGLNKEGQKLSRLIARQDRWVTICRPEDVSKYLDDSQ